MKAYYINCVLLGLTICFAGGCKKYLDINSDPDTPQQPDASSVFPAMLAGIPRGIQFDSRYIARYTQNYLSSASGRPVSELNWDNHGFFGFPTASDAGGDIWRQCYYGLGANLNYIINEGVKRGQWDYAGAAYALKAYMFQSCTDVYGEIIYNEAFKENTSTFRYDDQPTVYKGVDSLCRLALNYLRNTELSSTNTLLSKGDFVYNGNTALWIKFVNGLLARNFHRRSKKADYNADSVIFYADRSFSSVTDDCLIPFDASKTDDTNFFGPYRDNMTFLRQSNFIVKMLDGTTLGGASFLQNRDPRIKQMLAASQDTTNGNGGYRGVDPATGDLGATTRRVAVPWGDSTYANPSASRFDPGRGKYLFRDKAVSPVMTYSEIQFIKAEAAFKNNKQTAYTAYLNGINAHFDFINRSVFPRANVPLYTGNSISPAERTAYLNGNNVKRDAATLTLTDIMLQKYIALWGWGFIETWVDMRKYHYTDPDEATG
ncbi:MAG: SusD/RagB family nutrient-binding outer membrane lipoprotein, partial [Chitinophagaceae bacterium]